MVIIIKLNNVWHYCRGIHVVVGIVYGTQAVIAGLPHWKILEEFFSEMLHAC